MPQLPLLWLSTCFILGIFLGKVVPLGWGVWMGLFLLAVGLALWEQRQAGWRQRRRKWMPLPAGVLLAGFLLGGGRMAFAQPVCDARAVCGYVDQGEVRLLGVVAAPPEPSARSLQLRLNAQQIARLEDAPDATLRPVRGWVQVMTAPGSDWRYGDLLEVEGRLTTPPENTDFSYREYLARQGIYAQLSFPRIRLVQSEQASALLSTLYRLRQRGYESINQSLPQPEAALLNGILLGLDQDLPDDVYAAFRDTGTAHIIAISGFNIAVLAGLISWLLGRLVPRLWLPLAAGLCLAAYALMVGASPSVVRAAIMGGMGMAGQQIGRAKGGLTTLTFTAAAMCLFQPGLLWDASFQLSFSATLGLVFFAARLQAGFGSAIQRLIAAPAASRLTDWVGEYFLATLAAQLTTLPVIMVLFKRISLSSLLANPLVLPAQSGVMILGGVTLLGGLLFPGARSALGWLSWPLLAYTIHTVQLLARIPGGAVTVTWFGGGAALVCFLALVGLGLRPPKLSALSKWAAPGALLILGLLAGLACRLVFDLPDGRLHLVALDSPGGASYWLQTPSGKQVLIPGGSSGAAVGSTLDGWMPLRTRRLDQLVLLTGSSRALVNLDSGLQRAQPQAVWLDAVTADSAGWKELSAAWLAQGVTTQALEPGAGLVLDEGVTLRAIQTVEGGPALRLEYHQLRVLLPDGHAPGESAPGEVLLLSQADLLAAPPESWLERRPTLVIAPAGPQAATNWLTPAEHGWIALTSDGERLWVESER